MVSCTAIENYLENSGVEKTIDAVREVVNHVAPAMNNLSFTKGYTPTQWVLNSNPRDPSCLTSDEFNQTIHHDALTHPDFEEEMQRRNAAKMAFRKADADSRLHRALLRRHRSLRVPLAVGQK